MYVSIPSAAFATPQSCILFSGHLLLNFAYAPLAKILLTAADDFHRLAKLYVISLLYTLNSINEYRKNVLSGDRVTSSGSRGHHGARSGTGKVRLSHYLHAITGCLTRFIYFTSTARRRRARARPFETGPNIRSNAGSHPCVSIIARQH